MTEGKSGKTQQEQPIDLAAIRRRLAAGQGRQAWRSLAELAETPEFLESLRQEFPRETAWIQSLKRRDFLKLLAASLSLAGLSACLPQPPERIMPYSEAPEALVPGRPLFFATAMELSGYGRGLLVENHMGRPTKVEGNPDHPASLGATDPFAQASVLTLYDPERAEVITRRGQIQTWDAFLTNLAAALQAQAGKGGAGLRVLTGAVTSPTLASQLLELVERYPQARLHHYEPAGLVNNHEGANLAFGQPVNTMYDLSAANVILSLDDNFAQHEPGSLRYLRQFSARREVSGENAQMNRLYVVESTLSPVGGFADHRLPLQAAQVEVFARRLARRLGIAADPLDAVELPIQEGWLEALADDLEANRGSSLVLAGPQQSPAVHALAHAMNEILRNVGSTVTYTGPVEAFPENQLESLAELAQALQAGEVDLLVVLAENPLFNAPADLQLAEHYPKAGMSVYLGLYQDETALQSDWFIPAAHYLEMWGDTRAFDGTVSIVQPLIEPLFGGRSPYEIMAALLGRAGENGYDIVRGFWQRLFDEGSLAGAPAQTGEPAGQSGASSAPGAGSNDQGTIDDSGGASAQGFETIPAGFDLFWRKCLQVGIVPNTALPPGQFTLSLDPGSLPAPRLPQEPGSLEIVFEPDPSIWDGRFANNAWLQELPRPVTKLTWDNAVLVSPGTAERLELQNNDLVELRLGERGVSGPVWILPGQPDGTVTVHLGYGRIALASSRTRPGGSVRLGAGFNAYAIRTRQHFWSGYGLELRKTGRRYALAATQLHHQLEGRDLVRVADLRDFLRDPQVFHLESEAHGHSEGPPASLYPEYEYDQYAWGMAVNVNTCTGCNACVVACQAENNIPVVGKEGVMNGREMHWLRVDSYYSGGLENPETLFAPVPCMHCEKAPCEPVCPVEATVHSSEGLNEMVYNRCVGTRYCSNNCPYKVRRFNFYEYSSEAVPLQMLRNPDVTVRSRGVMEKCTYCVQRINAGRIQAKVSGQPVRDGEIVPACAQACPANAIVFGDTNDPESQVSRLKARPQNYAMLGELGTQPRTTYLGKLRNPNPRLPRTGAA